MSDVKPAPEMVIVSTLVTAVNPMSAKSDDLAVAILDRLVREHRTLQQASIAVLAGVLYHYAEAHEDGRNAAAVRMCTEIKALLEREAWAFNGGVRLPLV